MMKTFRYALVLLYLTLVSSFAHSQTLTTAYDLTTATAGSGYLGNQGYGGTVGMEFDVNSAAIKVTSLGVFDSGQNGFTNVVTAYIFEVGNSSPLASVSFSSSNPGTLEGYHNFQALSNGLVLQPGSYIIAAYGFSNAQLEGNELVGGFSQDTFNNGGGLISSVGQGVYAEAGAGAGAYPNNTLGGTDSLAFNAGTFQYTLYVPEPSSVPCLFGILGAGSMFAFRKSRLRTKKVA